MAIVIPNKLYDELVEALESAIMCDHPLVVPVLQKLKAKQDVLKLSEDRIERLLSHSAGDYIHKKEIDMISFHRCDLERGAHSYKVLERFLKEVPEGEYGGIRSWAFVDEDEE